MINQYTMKQYTKEELEFIKSNKDSMSNKSIAIKLNRNVGTIRDKIKNMGWSRSQESSLKIIRDSNSNRVYPKYAINNGWRKLVTVDGKRVPESHAAWGKPIPKGYVIHHKDFNHKNNKIDNLQLMTKEEHNRFHTSNEGYYGKLKIEGKFK